MFYLSAATILVGGLGMLNLALSLAILRRLRDAAEAQQPGLGVLAAGEVVEPVTVSTVGGESLILPAQEGTRVIAFFSPTCPHCEALLPKFLEFAQAERQAGRDLPLAVVSGTPEDSVELVAALSQEAVLVSSESADVMVKSFSVSGFPALVVLNEDGRVLNSGHDMAAVLVDA